MSFFFKPRFNNVDWYGCCVFIAAMAQGYSLYWIIPSWVAVGLISAIGQSAWGARS